MKRKKKEVEKPKRRRRKVINPYIQEVKKPRRKRVRKSTGPQVICDSNKCWYGEACPHKKPHTYTEKCENDFCSIMRIKTICRKVREGDK